MTFKDRLAAAQGADNADKPATENPPQTATVETNIAQSTKPVAATTQPKLHGLPSLVDLINQVNKAKARSNMTLLLYGAAKVGKTTLAATISKIDYIKRIWWFDIEKGIDAVVLSYQEGRLEERHIAKIIPIQVSDTRQDPVATETLLKAICGRRAVKIDRLTGKIVPDTTPLSDTVILFDMAAMTDEDLIVIDSLSQFGQSNLNAATLGKPSEYKLQLDDYGAAGKWSSDLLTTVQAAQRCHFLCITHVRLSEDELNRTVVMPLMGSSTSSANVAKHFNTVVYLEKSLKTLKATSSVLGSVTAQSGSRIGMVLDKEKNPCLATALIEAGYFPPNAV